MKPENFITAYEAALQTQQWQQIEPLIHDKATVTFSSGVVHVGKLAVQAAYQRNFNLIKNELFQIRNVQWVDKSETHAIYIFEFHWKGIINEQEMQGSGTGTSILIKENNTWLLLAEHLGNKAAP